MRWSRQIDPDFPAAARFNHLLVYVPVQPKLERPLWLDPSCEHCRVGVLPEPERGADALAFRAQVDAEGNLQRRAVQESTGSVAVAQRLEARKSPSAKRREVVEAAVLRTWPIARIEELRPIECDRAAGSCREELSLSVPAYAISEGDRLLVPLTMLKSWWEQDLRESRSNDLAHV